MTAGVTHRAANAGGQTQTFTGDNRANGVDRRCSVSVAAGSLAINMQAAIGLDAEHR